MAFWQAEDITLPSRFLTLVSHLIVTLCVVLDVDRIGSRISDDVAQKDDTLRALQALSYTAIASLLIEVFGLFAGATIFHRGLTCLYILLHFMGTVLVALFIEERWSLDAYIVLFTIFNAFPCLLEIMFGGSYLTGRFMEYSK